MTSLTDAPAESDELSFQKNLSELDSLRKEQQDGLWEKISAEDVQAKVKRCIELTALLRRSNTGPAKASGARGKSRARKTPPDIAQIRSGLYD